jgi:hypothetical protein
MCSLNTYDFSKLAVAIEIHHSLRALLVSQNMTFKIARSHISNEKFQDKFRQLSGHE